MDQITKRRTNKTRFTVNRVYQPARIECELLAQIFDLVEQGGRKDFALGDTRQEPVVSAVNAESNGLSATSNFGVNNPIQIIELEEVA
jgi:hypothetical protein